MLKCVFFDLDGVLIDTEPLYSRFWMEAAGEHGLEMSYEESLGLRSLDNKLARQHFMERYGSDVYETLRETRKARMEEYRREHPIQAKEGAAYLLERLLEKQVPYYIVTASPMERAQRYMKEAGLPWEPDRFISTKTMERGKPYPDVYEAAMKIAGVGPKEAIAVEDSPNGVCSANAAGCLAVMVPDLTQPTRRDLRNCYCVCNKLTELEDVIDDL